MGSLFRAWIIDPVALLFLLSLVLLLVLCVTVSKRSGARSRRGTSSRRRSAWPWLMLFVWIGIFLVCSAPVIVNPLISLMEDPYLDGTSCQSGSHMIVLGGGVDSRIQDVREYDRMSPATLARATAAARILLEEDELQTRVIVAGGAVRQIAEAEVIASYLQRLGVAAERISLESGSSNTRENALNVTALLADETVSGSVRLVTSAMHMPRALNTFRQVLTDTSIEVCPLSVDVQALKNVPAYAFMPQSTAIARFDLLLHEAVALLVYRLKGWL